ncbi:MAG: DUF6691 family protein [Alphaproteobacteria bacterium]
MRQIVGGLIAGLVFGIGLALSSMLDPAVVLGFLDVAGRWNPTLAFVMGGALAVTLVGYRLVLQRARPLWAKSFDLPAKRRIDAALVGGSALFGVGWGLTGYCPGPGIASLGGGRIDLFVFLAAMLAGMIAVRLLGRGTGTVSAPAATQDG